MIRPFLFAAIAAFTLLLGAVGPVTAAVGPSITPAPAILVAQSAPIERFHLRGRVTYFHGFALTLRSGGRPVAVELHQGTVILPTGLSLQPGMFVRIDGHWDREGSFHANRIALMH